MVVLVLLMHSEIWHYSELEHQYHLQNKSRRFMRTKRFYCEKTAKATLYGSSDAVTALAYDDSLNLLYAGTSSGRSEFQGLRRINNTTTAVTTAISASNGLIAGAVMTVRVNKQPFNIREKLSELERPIGLKGDELMRAETAQDARDVVSAGRKNLMINGDMGIVREA